MTLRDERPPEDDPLDLAKRLIDSAERYPAELPAVRLALDPLLNRQPNRTPPEAVPVNKIEGDFPKATLAAAGLGGVLLTTGQICLLSAEGGIGKSALTGALALATAMLPDTPEDGQPQRLAGGIFDGAGGPVLLATYEDPPPVTKWRITRLAERLDTEAGEAGAVKALPRVHVLDLSGWPLYGPPEQGSYSARPGPLPGWGVLWKEVSRIKPKLIVIDPVLKAYVGESNNVAPVREFLGAVANAASQRGAEAGVMLVLHSTKAARSGRPDPFDPGQVSGSGAWADECRGVLTMTWDENNDHRILAIPKSNWGPSRVLLELDPVQHESGAVIGFNAVGEWGKRAKTGKGKTSEENGRQRRMSGLEDEYEGIGR